MQLFGFISTTENLSTAYEFAWENSEAQKVRVVFKINFKGDRNFFVMDIGNYSHEKEILLTDGTRFIVQSVEDKQDPQGNAVKLITLQCF